MATRLTGKNVLDHSLTHLDVDPANRDGDPNTPCLRTLGTGAQQACAGNDPRLGAGYGWIYDEVPVYVGGKVYDLSVTPNPVESLQLFVNGSFMVRNSDYTIVGARVTFNKNPGSAAMRAFYRIF